MPANNMKLSAKTAIVLASLLATEQFVLTSSVLPHSSNVHEYRSHLHERERINDKREMGSLDVYRELGRAGSVLQLFSTPGCKATRRLCGSAPRPTSGAITIMQC